jgi:hypothetical protein
MSSVQRKKIFFFKGGGRLPVCVNCSGFIQEIWKQIFDIFDYIQ